MLGNGVLHRYMTGEGEEVTGMNGSITTTWIAWIVETWLSLTMTPITKSSFHPLCVWYMCEYLWVRGRQLCNFGTKVLQPRRARPRPSNIRPCDAMCETVPSFDMHTCTIAQCTMTDLAWEMSSNMLLTNAPFPYKCHPQMPIASLAVCLLISILGTP